MGEVGPDMRERILEAATVLFADRGFDGTPLQAIADAVGIRKPSLLYHHPSKVALREAVLDAMLARWKDVLPQVLLAATTGKDRFQAGLAEIIKYFEADPARARVLLREALDRPQELRQRIATHLQPWIGVVTEFIRQGQEGGRIRADVDPEAWVVEVVMMVVGAFATADVADAFFPGPMQLARDRRLAEVLRIAGHSLYRDRPE